MASQPCACWQLVKHQLALLQRGLSHGGLGLDHLAVAQIKFLLSAAGVFLSEVFLSKFRATQLKHTLHCYLLSLCSKRMGLWTVLLGPQGMKVKPFPKATLSLPAQENANRMPHRQSLTIQLLGSARRQPQQLNRRQMLHGKIYPSLKYVRGQLPYCWYHRKKFINPYSKLSSESSPQHCLAVAHCTPSQPQRADLNQSFTLRNRSVQTPNPQAQMTPGSEMCLLETLLDFQPQHSTHFLTLPCSANSWKQRGAGMGWQNCTCSHSLQTSQSTDASQ